jgi:hypothetical protein
VVEVGVLLTEEDLDLTWTSTEEEEADGADGVV